MIEFEIDATDLERMQKAVGATEKVVNVSLMAAIKRTQKWLATKIGREVAKATGVPPKAIKARIKLGKPTAKKIEARVWIGLNPIAAGKAGRPSGAKPGDNRRKAGVKVGKHRFPHAFILDGKRVVQRTGRERFPLENVTIPIAGKALAALRRRSWPDAQAFFLNEFERNLRFRMDRLATK